MSFLDIANQFIDTVGTALIEAEKLKQAEKRRAELRKNSIDVEHRVISEEVILSSLKGK